MIEPIRRAGTRLLWLVAVGTLLLWALLQVAYRQTFIYHDAWRAGFPLLFKFGSHATCGGLTQWVDGVDTGSPVMIYIVNFSLTHLFRVPGLYLIGCFRPDLIHAMYLTKAQIILSYLVFSGAMCILGCVLFQRRLAAVYLFVATLYAGLFLDVMHSDQVVAILFWIPWVIICVVLAHRYVSSPRAAWYINGAVFFLCLEALDQYPHFPLLAVVVGSGCAALLWPRETWLLLRCHARRLWPAAIILLITALQLATIKDMVMNYQPGQNRELVVNPAAFDDTGFVQATALVGSFFPLGFLGGFDRLAHDTAQWVRAHPWFAPRHGFIFKLDSLLFNLGFISTALAVAFLVRPGMGRVRLWWGATAAVILLISLQQSRLYLLLFHVPFFDVFRAYFLYVVFVVMAALVMSAYGMDAYLTLPEEERRRVLVRSLVIVGGIVAICAPVLLWLLGRRGNPGSSKAAVGWLVADLMIAAAGAAVLWLAGRARATERWAAIVIVVLVLSQTAYFVGAYKLVGISLSRVVATYGLDGEDFTPVSADIASDPSRFHRKPCTSFAQCYASQRDTASIVRFGGEWGGAFWRSKDDAIFQAAVSPAVVAALSGVSHPVFWLSRRVVTYQHRSELVTRFNQHSDRISEYLREAVSVLGRDVEALKLEADEVRHSSLTSLERDRDRVRLTYDTDGATILNAAITFDPHWIARVNGQPAAVVRGNFNGLAIWLPAGTGTVELVYDSWSSRALFASRYVALLLAVIIVGGVTWKAIGRPGPS